MDLTDYSVLADTYERLEEVSSKLKKADIIAEILSKIPSSELENIVLLLNGTVFPGHSQMDLGVADKMVIKSIMKATGFDESSVIEKFKNTGDLGLVVKECLKGRKQATLAKKKLTVLMVFQNMQKLAEITGSGSQDKKLNIIAEMVVSAKPNEARYIIRTILGNLRVGVSDGILRDSIVKAFLLKEAPEEKKENLSKEEKKEKKLREEKFKEEKKEATKVVDYALNIVSDFGEVARIAKEEGIDGLRKAKIELGKPIQVMLAEKFASIEEVLEKYKKVAIETKFDGMRAQVHKKGEKMWLYTRRLEDVTKQFPDVVKMMKESLKVDNCIVEGEILGINSKTGDPLPFQVLSQRVHRKHDIEKVAEEIPVQMNLFDIIYLDGKILVEKPFVERRKILENSISPSKKVNLAKQIVTENIEEAEKFYESALESKQEGIMLKVLDSPYTFGRHVDGWIKIKPVMETLDLVVIGATWGEGARARWLTSFVLACRDGDELKECGMMSTGFTEEEFKEMTEKMKSLILKEKGKEVEVKPEVVVEVEYQEIQKSPNYSSGFALRFPAFKGFRPDKGVSDADSIERVKKLYKSQGRAG